MANTDMHVFSDSEPKNHGAEQTGGGNSVLADDHISGPSLFRASPELISDALPRNSKRSCLVLEVFSGSCRLSKACRNAGFRVTAVDGSNSFQRNDDPLICNDEEKFCNDKIRLGCCFCDLCFTLRLNQ